MKVFVSKNFFPKREKIFDNSKQGKFDIKQPLQLVFIDGKTTLRIFKALYAVESDAYFVVQNLEYFLYKMRSFRNLRFEIVENSNTTNLCKDENICRIFGLKEEFECNSSLLDQINDYRKFEGKIKGTFSKAKRKNSIEANSIENSEVLTSTSKVI